MHLDRHCSKMIHAHPYLLHCSKLHYVRICDKCKDHRGQLFRIAQSSDWDETAAARIEERSDRGLYDVDYDVMEYRNEVTDLPATQHERVQLHRLCRTTLIEAQERGIDTSNLPAKNLLAEIEFMMKNESYRCSAHFPAQQDRGSSSADSGTGEAPVRGDLWWARPTTGPGRH